MKMADELPILKGILKGNFSYHNARKCKQHLQTQNKKMKQNFSAFFKNHFKA